MLTEFAPAKLNLALHLRRRRADGYHDLETVFAFTEFGDTLDAVPGEGLSLTVTGPFADAAGQGGENLVLRAARALAGAAGVAADAVLTLDKHIPVAAGLGGGSADAAATLRLLNQMWGIGWPSERLIALAAELGADVPACVAARTCFGTGSGDILATWPKTLTGTAVLLVNPRVPLPTPPVFAGWDGVDRGGIASGAALADLRNDMTAAAVHIAPVVADVLAALGDTRGVTLARMSGSGATCLGLYESSDACAAAGAVLAQRGWWTEATRLL